MEDKELITKIKLLKEVGPQEDWIIFCRSRLAFRLEMGRKKNLLNKDFFALKELFSFWRNFEPKIGFRWAYTLAIALIIVSGGGSLTVLAAMKCMPGSPLYPLKIALDRARLAAAFSEENKAKLQAEITGQRINELRSIVKGVDSDESKQEKAVEVFNQIEKQLADLDNRLSNNEGIEPRKAVKTAKIVSDGAGRIEKALAEVRQSISQDVKQNIGNKISAMAETADKTNGKALEIIADKQDDPATKKEIIAKVGEKIQDAREKIKLVGEQVAVQASSTPDKLSIRAVLVEKVQELLDQAEESLQKEDVFSAIKTVNIAKEITNGTGKIDGSSQNIIGAEAGEVQNLVPSEQNVSSSSTSGK